VRSVVVESASGPVDITVAPGKSATVSFAYKRYDDRACETHTSLEGGVLRVAVQQRSGGFDAACETAISLALPKALHDVSVVLGAGDMRLEGVNADVRFKLGAGDVVLRDVAAGSVAGRSGQGDVRFVGTLTEADVKIGAGDAHFLLTRTPPKGHLNLRLGNGNSVVELPRETRLKTTFKSGAGSLTNEFAEASSPANFVLSAAAGAGDLLVKRL
jgi:hypothetical protein